MRGNDIQQSDLFSYLSPEQRVPQDHPLRRLRPWVEAALKQMSGVFTAIYSELGRPSIPPEKLLRALLLQALYSILSERLLMEQLNYNLLFRWFVGLNMDDPVWDVSVFSKNRDRLLQCDAARAFFAEVLRQAEAQGLLSDEHFTVDGTLIEAWAGQKSFKKKEEPASPPSPVDPDPSNPTVDFHGEKRSNATHQSTTDPEARLAKKGKGKEAKLAYQGHVLMENRHGLVLDTEVTQATGTAEREAALEMLDRRENEPGVTLGADKNYDTRDFVAGCRERRVTPHVAQNNTRRSSAIDGRTTRHPGYAGSQRKRKRVEEIFGWIKTVALMAKTHFRGCQRVGWMFTLRAAAYNLVRLSNLVGRKA
jgi:transposase